MKESKEAPGEGQDVHGETYLDIVWKQFCKNKLAYYSLMILPVLFLLAILAPIIASNHPLTYYDGQIAQFSHAITGTWSIEEDDDTSEVRFRFEGASSDALGDTATITINGETFELPSSGRQTYSSTDSKLVAGLKEVESNEVSAQITIDGEKRSTQVGVRLYPWIRSLFNSDEIHDKVFNMAFLALLPVLIGMAVYIGWQRPQPRRAVVTFLISYIALTVLLTVFFSFSAFHPKDRYGQRDFQEEEFNNPFRHGVYTIIPFGPIGDEDTPSRMMPPGFSKTESEAVDRNDVHMHLLGTDKTGLDVLTRMLYGTRVALTVGFVAVSIYITIGIILGAVAGYFGGWTDILISRAIEVMMLFPAFFLILTLVGLIGPNIYVIMIVFGITGWPRIARLIRGEVLKQRAIDYVAASQSIGASNTRIIFRHIIPNALSPALVSAPFGIANAVVTEAGLSLLGFGLRPPSPSWGELLNQGNGNYSSWWLIVFPSIAIFITVTVFNLIGNGLRDAMDPRLRV